MSFTIRKLYLYGTNQGTLDYNLRYLNDALESYELTVLQFERVGSSQVMILAEGTRGHLKEFEKSI